MNTQEVEMENWMEMMVSEELIIKRKKDDVVIKICCRMNQLDINMGKNVIF